MKSITQNLRYCLPLIKYVQHYGISNTKPIDNTLKNPYIALGTSSMTALGVLIPIPIHILLMKSN